MKKSSENTNILNLIADRANSSPDKIAFYILDRNLQDFPISYANLYTQSYQISQHLIKKKDLGGRVLICQNPGIDYIVSFLGTLMAGMIAVPVFPPQYNKNFERIDSIVKNSQPKYALLSTAIYENCRGVIEGNSVLKNVEWICTETLEKISEPDVFRTFDTQQIAFLQYTSGSTSDPKGVVLTHKNLVRNLTMIQEMFGTSPASVGLSWLPPYHDMGLIGGILHPLFVGFPVYLMSPLTFVTRPLKWLEAISKFAVTCSGGPNFAYELCCSRAEGQEAVINKLDLSKWSLAFCGAEPIRKSTLDKFQKTFSGVGFDAFSFFPCYGLAEATLLVSGRKGLKVKKLENHEVEYVSCGKTPQHMEVKIFRPDSNEELPAETIGSVCMTGPNVSIGYWPVTEEGFLKPHDSWTPTGDLGFMCEGELYISGRSKELIIINGKNFFPNDIESVIGAFLREHKSITCVAFSITDTKLNNQLFIVVEKSPDMVGGLSDEVLSQKIQKKVFQTFEIKVTQLIFVSLGSLPRTSSGKIKRIQIRKNFCQHINPNTRQVTAAVLS